MSEFQKAKKSVLERADTVLGKIVVGMAILAGIGTFAMAIMICVGVVMRYFLNMSVAWTTEWSEYLIFIDVMLATPWVLKIDKHVRVDIIATFLKDKGKKILNQFISVLGIIMCGMFFYFSLIVVIEDLQSQVVLAARIMPIPRWIIMAFIPLMAGFCILIFFRKLIIMGRHDEMHSDADYQEYEEKLMNPRYSTAASTNMELLDYDEISKEVTEDIIEGEATAASQMDAATVSERVMKAHGIDEESEVDDK